MRNKQTDDLVNRVAQSIADRANGNITLALAYDLAVASIQAMTEGLADYAVAPEELRLPNAIAEVRTESTRIPNYPDPIVIHHSLLFEGRYICGGSEPDKIEMMHRMARMLNQGHYVERQGLS